MELCQNLFFCRFFKFKRLNLVLFHYLLYFDYAFMRIITFTNFKYFNLFVVWCISPDGHGLVLEIPKRSLIVIILCGLNGFYFNSVGPKLELDFRREKTKTCGSLFSHLIRNIEGYCRRVVPLRKCCMLHSWIPLAIDQPDGAHMILQSKFAWHRNNIYIHQIWTSVHWVEWNKNI